MSKPLSLVPFFKVSHIIITIIKTAVESPAQQQLLVRCAFFTLRAKLISGGLTLFVCLFVFL